MLAALPVQAPDSDLAFFALYESGGEIHPRFLFYVHEKFALDVVMRVHFNLFGEPGFETPFP